MDQRTEVGKQMTDSGNLKAEVSFSLELVTLAGIG
jgi:hypothetical protein